MASHFFLGIETVYPSHKAVLLILVHQNNPCSPYFFH